MSPDLCHVFLWWLVRYCSSEEGGAVDIQSGSTSTTSTGRGDRKNVIFGRGRGQLRFRTNIRVATDVDLYFRRSPNFYLQQKIFRKNISNDSVAKTISISRNMSVIRNVPQKIFCQNKKERNFIKAAEFLYKQRNFYFNAHSNLIFFSLKSFPITVYFGFRCFF